MRISLDNLKEIIKQYRSVLIHKRITDIVLVNSRLFLFTLKNEERKLIVDLDNVDPHIGLIKTDYDELSLPSEFIAKALMKGSPFIEDASLVNDDRIIKITTSATDAYYHHNKYYLYIELINAHANMILTDENNQIIVAFYETNLMSPRLIVKNTKYLFPTKKNEDRPNPSFLINEYQKYIEESFKKALEKRKKELYGSYLKKYEKKVKSLEKKISKILESKENAKQAIIYKENGDTLLMHASDIKRGDIVYKKIKLDPTKSAVENANIYFNKYKKAKRTIENTDTILKEVNKELEEAKYYLDLFTYANEVEIKLFLDEKRRDKDKIEHNYLPYYIKHLDTTYYYGRNALENDYLTFKMFKKSSDVTWMHMKDKPGVHLIINKINPTNQELDIAASILLIKNKLTAGEIMYTSRKNITRGEGLAKVNVLNYKSITMRKINHNVIELLKRERRVHE